MPACEYLEIIPSPNAVSGTIEVTDCQDPVIQFPGGAVGSKLFFNAPVEGCGRVCGLPTKETNWGKIKAMYN